MGATAAAMQQPQLQTQPTTAIDTTNAEATSPAVIAAANINKAILAQQQVQSQQLLQTAQQQLAVALMSAKTAPTATNNFFTQNTNVTVNPLATATKVSINPYTGTNRYRNANWTLAERKAAWAQEQEERHQQLHAAALMDAEAQVAAQKATADRPKVTLELTKQQVANIEAEAEDIHPERQVQINEGHAATVEKIVEKKCEEILEQEMEPHVQLPTKKKKKKKKKRKVGKRKKGIDSSVKWLYVISDAKRESYGSLCRGQFDSVTTTK